MLGIKSHHITSFYWWHCCHVPVGSTLASIKGACRHVQSLQSCLTLQPHGLQPTRLLCPWDSPGKNTGVGCHFLLRGIFWTQALNPGLSSLLHWSVDSLPWSHLGSPSIKAAGGGVAMCKKHRQFIMVSLSMTSINDLTPRAPPLTQSLSTVPPDLSSSHTRVPLPVNSGTYISVSEHLSLLFPLLPQMSA